MSWLDYADRDGGEFAYITHGSTVISNSLIKQGGLSVDRYTASGSFLEFGNVSASELSLTLDNSDEWFDWEKGDVITVEIDRERQSESTPTADNYKVGTFIVDSVTKSLNTVNVVALDSMVLLDVPFDWEVQTYDITKSDDDFYDNGFRNGASDYVGRVSYSRDYFQLLSRFRFDKESMDLNHMENSLYLGKNNNYLTLGHIWDTQPIDIYQLNDQDTHELSAGAGLQITNRIHIKGSAIYNIYEHMIQRHNGGIYYEHPCYYLSLGYQRDNATRNGYVGNTTIQFKFGISIDGKHY